MKFFDMNCSIGGWPFRSVPRHTAAEVYFDLKALGAMGGAVVNNGALLYSDTGEANRELAEAIAPYGDFFTGVATIDPKLPRAREELDYCVDVLNFRALRLLPLYHNCAIDDPDLLRLAAWAGKRGVPLLLPREIANFRQRHRLEPERALTFDEAAMLARAVPETKIVWQDAILPQTAKIPPNMYGEFARGWTSLGNVLEKLVAKIGMDRFVIGTAAPLRTPEVALLKLGHAELTRAEREAIAFGNARKLLKQD